ncbi:MAG TPA: DNA-3-methyladenine glycosylase I [Cryomorphaceae bacterium]|nr:DNA-3-methyladenine glycosylase I [Owenweeksia sp.]MBF98149.1 DNA-3-methyladenine glycosylase I [Owenweeksia sp.]HAD96502.1 DNA-3-methyladenine glycosylase I [Cryomorphaceae bacterium]HCQ16138.1 DNA-3-methyladenine glycosylase I [Cryomorphaceae bacterium]|tara:strand:+ start:9701 stop:10288 length:588 start_codon:yes stop_codon:yes gene_type:complete
MEHRCGWVNNDPLYMEYHDKEWGVPVQDDQKMFEFLLLETFQAGLSWYTILKKRENFRKAFADFDYHKVAAFTETDRERLMQDAGIIRNRQKIHAAITNAQQFMVVQKEWGSFCKYIWSFVDFAPLQNSPKSLAQVPATSDVSDKLSKDLKKRGFKFVGSTTIYAHMQACGMVNDHTTDCFRQKEVQKMAKELRF